METCINVYISIICGTSSYYLNGCTYTSAHSVRRLEFTPVGRLPPCSIRQALTYLLDLKTPPSQALLKILAPHAADTDSVKMTQLANVTLHIYFQQ